MANKIIRFFTAVKCKFIFAVEKSYGQTRYYFRLLVSHITVHYVNVVSGCVASMLYFAETSKRSGQVRGKEIKNLRKTPKANTQVELSDFDKKYYDLHINGFIPRKHYEQSRLLHLMYMETNLENEGSVLQ